MIATSIFIASLILLAAGLYVVGDLTFLAPWRAFILHRYGRSVSGFAIVLFLNLFAGVLAINRKLFLKDTGRKLAHVEKQLRTPTRVVQVSLVARWNRHLVSIIIACVGRIGGSGP